MCAAIEPAENQTLKRRIAFADLMVEQKTAAYAEMTRIISVIEDKGQKTALSAGALLALGVPIMTKTDIPAGIRVGVSIILFMAVALCIASYVFCLLVMWVREVAGPPHLYEMQRALHYVLEQGDDQMTEAMELRVKEQQSVYWDRALEGHELRAQRKAKALGFAQGFLAAGGGRAGVCAGDGVDGELSVTGGSDEQSVHLQGRPGRSMSGDGGHGSVLHEALGRGEREALHGQ
jgi:hypothetical protein